jgi:hypothetical protein
MNLNRLLFQEGLETVIHFVSSNVMRLFMRIYTIVFKSDSRLARIDKSRFKGYQTPAIPRKDF